MSEPKQPKERARKFLQEEVARRRPPPSQEEIRRRLGWNLKPKRGK